MKIQNMVVFVKRNFAKYFFSLIAKFVDFYDMPVYIAQAGERRDKVLFLTANALELA
jgi:hypothetical protein